MKILDFKENEKFLEKYETPDIFGNFKEYTLPICAFKCAGFDNKDVVGKRFCIVIVQEGSGLLSINGQAIAYMSPCILCLNETEHIEISDENSICRVIYFHPSAINCAFDFNNIREIPDNSSTTFEQDVYWTNEFLYRDDKYKGYIAIGPVTLKRFQFLVDSMSRELVNQTKKIWPCRSRSYLIETFFAISNLYDNCRMEGNSLFESSPVLENSLMYPVLTYIYNHYNEKLSVTDMTERFHINRTTFTAKMEEAVGASFVVYVNKLRISMATILLRDTELPVNEIMYRVGFSDSAHFSRIFKKHTGTTPKEYRDKNFTYCYGR